MQLLHAGPFFIFMENKIAVLYSFEQSCFHIESLQSYILSNVESSLRRVVNQFRLIAVVDTDTQADSTIKDYKENLKW